MVEYKKKYIFEANVDLLFRHFNKRHYYHLGMIFKK